MPGISGFARYMNSWMDADVSEKQRILAMLKDAAGIGAVSTEIKGARQQMRLRGAAEERTQALFPDIQRTGTAGAGQEESRLATMEREERGAVERENAEREIQGMLSETLAGLLKGQQYDQALQIIDVQQKLRFPELAGRATVEQARQAGAEAGLGAARAEALVGAKEPAAAADAAIKELGAAGAEAGVRQLTAEEQVKQQQPAATVRAQVEVAGAAALKAQVQNALDSRRLDSEYADVVTDAEINIEKLKDDMFWQQLKLLEAQTAKAADPAARARAPTELEMLRDFVGDEAFAEMLIQKHMVEIGYYDTAPNYMSKIQSAITSYTQITAAMQTGEDVNAVLAQIFRDNEDFKVMLGTSGAQDKTDPNVILRELARYIGVQKTLLKKKWGRDYKALSLLGQATHTYTAGDTANLIRFVEQNMTAPGAVGEMLRNYKPLQHKSDVITGLTNIMNKPDLHFMYWEQQLERLGKPNPEFPDMINLRQLWGEQDFESARAILRAAQHQLLQGLAPSFDVTRPPPGQTPQQTPVGAQQ